MKRAAPHLLTKIALFSKLSNFYFDLRPRGLTPGQDRGAKTRTQGQLECANPRGGGGVGLGIDWYIRASLNHNAMFHKILIEKKQQRDNCSFAWGKYWFTLPWIRGSKTKPGCPNSKKSSAVRASEAKFPFFALFAGLFCRNLWSRVGFHQIVTGLWNLTIQAVRLL